MRYPGIFSEHVHELKIESSCQLKILMGIQDHFIANLYPEILDLTFKVFMIDPQNKKGAI